jgi:1,4-dihydroxy-6-naphthoate synthase
MPNTPTAQQTLRLGHSPDPDDAFMWYPLANFVGPDGKQYKPLIDTAGYGFEHVLEDIQSLNERSFRGELEITAISIHTYPYVAAKYALTSCGASLGDGYGPMIVTADANFDPASLTKPDGPTLAIPGKQTSAWLGTQLWLNEMLGASAPSAATHGSGINHEVVAFDQIIEKVASGEYAAGLIIHEGQLTYSEHDLHLIVDLGRWWQDTRGLPLPLGGNCVRRDLGQPAMGVVCDVLKRSIEYALEHRDEAVRFSLNWARGMEDQLADRFVGMYVNDWTLDYGDDGRAAVRQFLKEGIDAGLVPDCGEVDFVEPGRP